MAPKIVPRDADLDRAAEILNSGKKVAMRGKRSRRSCRANIESKLMKVGCIGTASGLP
jgi:hypothetical protein